MRQKRISESIFWLAGGAAAALFGCGSREAPPRGGGTVTVPDSDAATSTDAPGDLGPTDASRRSDASSVPCSSGSLDLLVVVDNSNSMAENQSALTRSLGVLLDSLLRPPTDPLTMRPRYPAVRNLHVGVVSSDLGTAGSSIPSCANGDQGDDGLLNPVRYGLALRTHAPWTSAPPGRRPTACTNDLTQYPSFLSFDAAGAATAASLRDDVACNAYLSVGGCGLEQQLESAYRALVIRDPRARPGNPDPNAGFLRDEAILGILMFTDEDDGSVRDCRYAEPGVACNDATGVYNGASSAWSSPDLNLRFYMYTPGSQQDPTWPIDRYVDPRDPTRGFPGLKPGHPERVLFSAIVGVPIALPRRAGSSGDVDWDVLLGRAADGSDALVAASPEGSVSMRPGNLDPMCSARVVPACRREGSTAVSSCDPAAQYFAWPSRRIAQVARRFAETWRTGAITSICAADYSPALGNLLGGRECAGAPDAAVGDAAVDAGD